VIARGGTIEGRLKLCDTLSGVFKKCQKNKKKLILNKNTKKNVKRNKFLLDTLGVMGGGETRNLAKNLQILRSGATPKDMFLSVLRYGVKRKEINEILGTPQEYAAELFGMSKYKTDIHVPLFEREVFRSLKKKEKLQFILEKTKKNEYNLKKKVNIWNFAGHATIMAETSPGALYKTLGFKSKGESVALLRESCNYIVDRVTRSRDPPDFLWNAGGRPKLRSVVDACSNVLSDKTNGRAIWAVDAEESVLSQVFTKPLYELLDGDVRTNNIMIGFNKVRDSLNLRDNFIEQHDCLMEFDYSKFDTRLPGSLISFCFDIISEMFDLDGPARRLLQYLKRNFIHSKIIGPDGYVYQKDGGIPSGSGFTSIIGSIANYVMVKTLFKTLGYTDDMYDILVYGDDVLVGLKNYVGFKPFKLTKYVRHFLANEFGCEIKEDEIKITSHKYVRYAVPDYGTQDTSKGTSHLKPVKTDYYAEYPTSEVLTTSHRWYYSFAYTWKFLSYSMLPDGSMIRPTSEIVDRICNPENPVNSVDDHVTCLKMALIENFDNLHTRNRVYHYLYDCYWLIKHGVSDRKISLKQLQYRDREVDSTGEGCRMWYRREDGYVSLESSDCMREYNEYYYDLIDKIKLIRQSEHIDENDIRMLKQKGSILTKINLNGVASDVSKKVHLLKTIGMTRPGVLNDLITSHVFSKVLSYETVLAFLTCSHERGTRSRPVGFEYLFRFRNMTRKWLQLSRITRPVPDYDIKNPDMYAFYSRKESYVDSDINYGKRVDSGFYKRFRMNIKI
jgi:hypothetical protein